MRRSLLFLFAVLTVSQAGAEPPSTPPRPSQLGAEEVREVLARHNAARQAVGGPPLTWSPRLADYAQAWADEIARTGKFEHRSSSGDGVDPRNDEPHFGENLAVGFGPGFGAGPAVEQWRAEEAEYLGGTPIPELPDNFVEFKAGHYTQMVWRATRSIGVGKAVIQTGEMAGWTVFVANYDPPGNVGGQKPY